MNRMSFEKRSALWKKRRAPTRIYYIFQNIVIDENCCWRWKNTKEGSYGAFEYDNETGSAHRRVYELIVGPIPEGKILRHSCDHTYCVNPDHLIPGTKKENREDFMRRNPRAKEICLIASKIGVVGVKNFWDSMSKNKRRSFCKRRARIQMEKRLARLDS